MIGWAGSAFVVLSVWLMSGGLTTRVFGHIFGQMGCVLWMIHSYHMGDTPLFVLNTFLFCVYTVGGFRLIKL